ncbi:DUF4190 domain-containing protein [Cellulomonas wangsupingiae]|uniref:DUF4190 domain-containing protein n=1 Tax=Cellulomonas wangsupingiae TaxID=2968085 RepID=UPI001D0E685A|nr:DUF4190 domain-containing protein [Cellulomonas wangsupingiae]MCM0638227.1 DUF4190 domain-containing protein [Cellulomonas wangsupingiae]
MSQSHDPQPGPVYGQEGAYAPHDAPRHDVPGPPPGDVPPPPGTGGGPVPPPVGPADGRASGTYPPAGYPPAGYPPAGYPPAGYPPPGAGAYMPRNDLAVWSLVLGLLGVLGCVFFTGIPAVVVGANARKAVAAGQADNEGMATAGIVLGWVATGLGVLVVALFLMALVPLFLVGLTVPFMSSVP